MNACIYERGIFQYLVRDAEVRSSPLLSGMLEVHGPAYTWEMKYETIHSRFSGTWVERWFGWLCDFSDKRRWFGEAAWKYWKDIHWHIPVENVVVEEDA